jgi:hypothetical protein
LPLISFLSGVSFGWITTTFITIIKSRFCHRKCRGRFCPRIAAELSSNRRTHKLSELIY